MNIEGGKKDNQCLKDLWESIKHDNKQVMEIPEVKEIEGNVEKKNVFEELALKFDEKH